MRIVDNHSSMHATSSRSLEGGRVGTVVAWMSWAIVCSQRRDYNWLVGIKALFSFQGLNCQCRLPSAFVVIPGRQISSWKMAGFWLLCKNCTTPNTFHLVLLICLAYLIHLIHLAHLTPFSYIASGSVLVCLVVFSYIISYSSCVAFLYIALFLYLAFVFA